MCFSILHLNLMRVFESCRHGETFILVLLSKGLFYMNRACVEKTKELQRFSIEFLSNSGLLSVLKNKYIIVPGLCDVHVHFREPGFSYKETILTGSCAAAHGGYTAVCTMPNLNPVPDSQENLRVQLDLIDKDAKIKILPYGSITKGEKGEELSDMEEMSRYVCAFSDDGRGVQNREIMRDAMIKAKSLNKIIAAHCEDNSKLFGGYIHDGTYAKIHGHKGISSESEYCQIARDIELAKETGCAYHVCHISTKESVALIRKAKAEGIDITCETAPHYLVLSEDDLVENGCFKMNPPLRSKEDKQALLEGLIDGTIDMISTDHAPHSAEEKGRGLEKSLMGVVGLETAFAVLYTELVMKDIISLDRLTELMSYAPKNRFDIDTENDFAVFDISTPYKIDSKNFLSKGKATPFDGKEVYGKCLLTVLGGKILWKDPSIEK